MANSQEIINRIKAAKEEAPTGAFVTEISSNEAVVGNLNSKHMYNQTPEKDNGFAKQASNRYLEKIAESAPVTVKPNAINKMSLGLSALGLGVSAANYKNNLRNAQADAERKRLEEKSLRALYSINRNLSDVSLVKQSELAPINRFAQKALNNIGKSISTNVMAPSKIKVFRPKGI